MWLAHAIDAFERRRSAPRAFKYKDKGSMATIGRRRAVAHVAGIRMRGTLAWLAWLFVHLMYVVGFANRVLVLVRWMSSYVANGRGERVLVRTVQAGAPTASRGDESSVAAVRDAHERARDVAHGYSPGRLAVLGAVVGVSMEREVGPTRSIASPSR